MGEHIASAIAAPPDDIEFAMAGTLPLLSAPITPRETVALFNGKDLSGFYTWKSIEFSRGRIDWRGRDREWKDVLGFRGREDVEKPAGQWNRIKAICDGGDVAYFVNDVKVNEATGGTFKEGPILFQSEAAEILFRRVELHPLKE